MINIGIIKTIDDDTDPRWNAVHMLDKANAIIHGISRNKGDPAKIIREGYVEEKVRKLNRDWNYINL